MSQEDAGEHQNNIDTSKKARATAKSLFTKTKKNLIRAIENKSDILIIEGRMEELKRMYNTAQEKHEEYMTLLNIGEGDEGYDQEDAWIEDVDKAFDEVEIKKVAYAKGQSAAIAQPSVEKDEQPAGVVQPNNHEKQYLSMRKVEEIAFNSLHESVAAKIAEQMKVDEPITEIIKEELSDLKRQSEACKQAHHKYISTLSNPSDEIISWAKPFQDKITKLTKDFSRIMQKKVDAKPSGIPHEKLKMLL